MNTDLINGMATPETCNNDHNVVIFDSRYGERSCPVCEALEQNLKDEEIYDKKLKVLEEQLKVKKAL